MINDSGQMSKFCELEKTIIIRFPFRQNNFLQNQCIGHVFCIPKEEALTFTRFFTSSSNI